VVYDYVAICYLLFAICYLLFAICYAARVIERDVPSVKITLFTSNSRQSPNTRCPFITPTTLSDDRQQVQQISCHDSVTLSIGVQVVR
jgi:hypothetical protein